MPNYSIISNARFRPFSYQEMLQPVLAATQAHQALEDSYADLATKASVWDKMTNPETDTKAHGIYSAYARDLEQQAERLSRYGLDPNSRQRMLAMRSRYSSDILPIEQAYKRREEQIAEQRKAGNSMIYDYDAATTSLDRFLDNPSLSYESIDRRDLYNRSMADFGQYAKALQDYGNGKRLDKFTETFIQRYGITQDDARNFIEAVRSGNINTANPTLRAVYDALYNSTGVGSWGNPQAQNIVSSTILEGVGAAIGKTTISPYEDKAAVMAQQLANQKAALRYQQELATAAQERQRMRMYDINPTTYYSASEVARQNQAVSKNLDKWKAAGYFNADGKLTNKGWKALQYRAATRIGTRYDRHGREIPMYSGGSGDYEFYRWATSHGVTNAADRYSVNILNKYYANTRTAIANGTLATGTANFDVYRQAINNTQDQSLIANKVNAAIGEDGKIYRAGSLQDGTIRRGEGFTQSEWRNLVKDNPVLYVTNSPTTGQQLVELSNGQKFLLPSGILGNDVVGNLSAANQAIRNSGSAAERATYLNLANSYLGSILTTNTGTEIKPNDGTVIFDIGEQYGKEKNTNSGR